MANLTETQVLDILNSDKFSIDSSKAPPRRRWIPYGVAGLTAGTTFLVFLSASHTSYPSGETLLKDSSHTPTTPEQIEELASVLSESMFHNSDSGPQSMKDCVANLVRLVESYQSSKLGPMNSIGRKPLQLPMVTPSCHYLSLAQQQEAFSYITLMLKYQASLLGSRLSLLYLVSVLSIPLIIAPLAYCFAIKPRNSKPRKTREACSCRVCKGKYVVGKSIGSGGFASAHLTVVDGKRCVLKMIQVDLVHGINQAQTALEEAKNLMKLAHTNIVQYRDVFLHRTVKAPVEPDNGEDEIEDYVCILMELCDGTLLHRLDSRKMSLREILNFLQQTAAGFSYMHSKHCIHRDVKPENIFFKENSVTKEIVYKIGDFGLALTTDGGKCCNLVPYGTTAFMSPECFDRQTMDPATDVWSLGITLLETVVGESHVKSLIEAGVAVCPPSDAECDEASLCEVALNDPESWNKNRDILVSDFRERLQNLYNKEYYELCGVKDTVTMEDMLPGEVALEVLPQLLRSMLAFDPSERPTMAQVFQHLKTTRRTVSRRLTSS